MNYKRINKELREEQRDGKKSRVRLQFYEIKRLISHFLFGSFKMKRTLSVKTKRLIFVWGCLLFPILNFLIFYVYVNANSILLAFKNIDYAAGGVEYWTLKNFKRIYTLFTNPDPETDLLHYGANTLKYWLLNFFMIVQSVFLTYLFQKKFAGHRFYRLVLYIPGIVGSVVMAGVFRSFISSSGVLGHVMYEWFNVERVPNFFAEKEYATKMLLFYSYFTGFAGHYMIFSGAMARIPQEIHEVSALDGIKMWKELWYIDIPLMWPTLSMTLLSTFSTLFAASGPILLFTPRFKETYTFGYFIFDQVNEFGSYYIPSALGLIFTIFAFPLCLMFRKLLTSIYPDVD